MSNKVIRGNVVGVDAARQGLMEAINRAVQVYTRVQPMSLDAIVGCLSFMAGAAIIGSPQGRLKSRAFKEMAQGNIERGMEAAESVARRRASSLVLSEGPVN